MKISFKQQMNDLIRSRGEILYNELNQLRLNRHFGRYYKETTMMRRLEESESPNIGSTSEDGHIVKYFWKGEPIKYQHYKTTLATGEVKQLKFIIK
uniref:Uncharacterized protein n=1 Tax=viral metagenome TaxID=1070528 RepID=A0A6H1ZFW1_9ZZZZ